MSNGYDRWCPSCGVWVKPDDLRVRDDGSGLKRHVTCEAVTSPTKITAGEHVLLDSSGGKSTQKCTCDTGWDHYAVPVKEGQVTTTTLREDAAEALAALEKHAVDPETGAKPVSPKAPADIGGGWGLPDNPKQDDCTLFGMHVIGYDEATCTCGAGGDMGHEHYCGWAPFAKPVEWLKKLAPGVKFTVLDVDDQEFLHIWDGQLFDVPNETGARDDLEQARVQRKAFAVYALVRIPDEVVSRDE